MPGRIMETVQLIGNIFKFKYRFFSSYAQKHINWGHKIHKLIGDSLRWVIFNEIWLRIWNGNYFYSKKEQIPKVRNDVYGMEMQY